MGSFMSIFVNWLMKKLRKPFHIVSYVDIKKFQSERFQMQLILSSPHQIR